MRAPQTFSRKPVKFPMGFTLIELLVVVVVIAILLVLALVAVRNTMQSAAQTKCVSNLRTIGMAIHLYSADHNGFLPPAIDMTPNPAGGGFPPGEIWYRSFIMWLYAYATENPGSPASIQTVSKLIKCPADRTETTPALKWQYVSYAPANHFLQTWLGGTPQNSSRVTRYVRTYEVTKKILLMDGVTTIPFGANGSIPPIASVISNRVSDRHRLLVNCLFGDGHVRSMPKSELLKNRHLLDILSESP